MLKNVHELTLAEAQLEAALAEGLCPTRWTDFITNKWTDKHPEYCKECKGTGRVPLLPGLRKPCLGCSGNGFYTNEEGIVISSMPCRNCGGTLIPVTCGRGWVPETDEFEALAALPLAGRVGVGSRFAWVLEVNLSAETLRLAFWRALVAWCRARQEAQP